MWPHPSDASHFRNWKPDPLSRRLMQWVGESPPTEDSIAGAALLDQAQAHIKTILETGPAILGHRALERDGIEPRLEVSHRRGGTVWLQRGYERRRRATAEEAATLPVFSTWGYRFIALVAESRLDGEVQLRSLDRERTEVHLVGRFRPPTAETTPTEPDELADRLTRATVRSFLRRVATAIEVS